MTSTSGRGWVIGTGGKQTVDFTTKNHKGWNVDDVPAIPDTAVLHNGTPVTHEGVVVTNGG